ncbi:MAG: hypothetical protein FWD49_06460 [Firmicutes bacterium]|nr:hypothetical protein [Bacillota bacterium]
MDKKSLIAKIILLVLGFPLLVALVLIQSLPIITDNITYGIMPFVGLILAVVFMGAWFLTVFLTGKKAKKQGTKKAVKKGFIAMLIVGLFLTLGVWGAIDILLPDILEDATDGTILYHEVREDYIRKSEHHAYLLEKFIDMNIMNGKLSGDPDVYDKEGYRNQEVRDLIASSFAEIDTHGYNSFLGAWLNLALDDRMTIAAIAHLLLDARYEPDFGEKEGEVKWTILDMQEGAMEVDLNILPDNLLGFARRLVSGFGRPITRFIEDLVELEEVAGSPIYFHLRSNLTLTISNSTEERGVFDYMQHAWLNSNHLLVAVISLFPLRNLFLIFAGVLVITSLLIYHIREKEFVKDKEGEDSLDFATHDFATEQATANDGAMVFGDGEQSEGLTAVSTQEEYVEDASLSPYENAYLKAKKDRGGR